MKRNPLFSQLTKSYLFPEIHRRKCEFLARHPGTPLLNLGIGDTTQPLVAPVTTALERAAQRLGTREGYTGYGPEKGVEELRAAIARTVYQGCVSADEITISDGAKCDIGRLLMLFGASASLAVQDPTYPAYVDNAKMVGMRELVYLPCSPSNGFFPDLPSTPRTDLLVICSPNNPTGVSATRQQLEELVAFARENRSIILYDAAYAAYIRDPTLPKSIYEIPGAQHVAIEVGSFSKLAGFTGVRLGWAVVPTALAFDDGACVAADWSRLMTTAFNGASNLAQAGGIAVLDSAGYRAINAQIEAYMANAARLRDALRAQGLVVYGAENAPFLWVHFPGKDSWDVFTELLEHYHIVTIPGGGFGPAGKEFVRMTAFASSACVDAAIARLCKS